MDFRSLILLVTAISHLLVGGFVVSRNPRGVVHRAVLLETSVFAAWALLMMMCWRAVDEPSLLWWGRLTHVAALFCCTGFVTLGLVFPGEVRRISRYLHALLWPIGIVVSVAVVATPDLLAHARMENGRLISGYGPLRHAYFGYLMLCIAWGCGHLLISLRRARGVRRLRMEYLLVGLAITALLNIPPDIIAPLLGIHSLVWMGPVLSLAFVLMVAHAIVRHRLMGIRLFVSGFTAQVISLALAAGLFAWLLWAANQVLVNSNPSVPSIAALVIALIFQPLRIRVQRAVSRYFHRNPYDYQSTVREASLALAAVLDLERALAYLLDTVMQALKVERAVVLIRDSSQGFRVRAARSAWEGHDDDLPTAGGLAVGSPLLLTLEPSRDPIVREELDGRMPLERARAVTADMQHFHADVAVPLFSGNMLLAVLLVGPKLSGDGFNAQDIDLLATLGAEAAGAIAYARLHQEMMQAEKLATLGGVAAGIAHEVKNPLVAVRTFADLLPDNYNDPEFRERFAPIVVQEVDRIDRLIGQLLDYARPKPPRLEPVDLNVLVQETLLLLHYELSRNEAEVSQTYAPDLPRVMADASQLRQVILNVILNAVQVMPQGSALRITTRAPRGSGDGGEDPYLLPLEEMVQVEIANGGPPIDVNHLDKVFEPFFSTRAGGTGLGLSICKRIITEHHGDIRASITEDGMTAFTIRLPEPPATTAGAEQDEAGSLAVAGLDRARG